MTSEKESEIILSYFSTNTEKLEFAKNELVKLATNAFGGGAEAQILDICDDEKMKATKEKIKELRTYFYEGDRLEKELKIVYEKYLAEIGELGENAQNTTPAEPSNTDHSKSGDENTSTTSAASKDDRSDGAAKAGAMKTVVVEPPEMITCTEIKLLTDAEFATVPKYMKGSATLAVINGIIPKFNNVLKNKYRILANGMRPAAPRDRDLYVRYNDQETKDSDGRRCCVMEDLRDVLDPREANLLQKSVIPILRHLKRLKDERFGKTMKLIVLYH